MLFSRITPCGCLWLPAAMATMHFATVAVETDKRVGMPQKRGLSKNLATVSVALDFSLSQSRMLVWRGSVAWWCGVVVWHGGVAWWCGMVV